MLYVRAGAVTMNERDRLVESLRTHLRGRFGRSRVRRVLQLATQVGGPRDTIVVMMRGPLQPYDVIVIQALTCGQTADVYGIAGGGDAIVQVFLRPAAA